MRPEHGNTTRPEIPLRRKGFRRGMLRADPVRVLPDGIAHAYAGSSNDAGEEVSTVAAPQYQGTAFACMSAVPVCSTVAFGVFLAACAATAV